MAEENWKDGLPDELKAAPALKDVADVGSLAKQFVDLQAHLGNSIRIPGEGAAEADVSAFYKKLTDRVPGLMPKPDPTNAEAMTAIYMALGRPETADKYVLPTVEGVNFTDDRQKTWKELGHKAGLTQNQLENLIKPLMEMEATATSVAKTQLEESHLALKKEWGVLYEDRMSTIAKLMAENNAPPALVEAVKNKTADPDVLRWLSSTYQAFTKEGSEFSQQGKTNQTDAMIPAEATIKAAEIRRKLYAADAPRPSSAEYQALLKDLLKYEQLANPGASTDINDLRRGSALPG